MGALKTAARKGIGNDTRLAHLSNGDVVLPVEAASDPETKKKLVQFFKSKNLDLNRFTVGHERNRKNPHTRLPMFDAGDAEGGGGGAGGPGAGGGAPGDPSGGGGGPGGASGESETGGGANAPGTGGNIGGAGPGAGPGGIGTVGGPDQSDPSTGSTTAGIGQNAPSAGTLTGTESTTAVESGTIPGTPEGTAPQLGIAEAAGLGQLGKFGQPNLGVIGNLIGNFAGPSIQGALNDPVGTLAALGIDIGIGAIPGLGIANSIAGLTGIGSLGKNVVGAVEGGLSGLTGTAGGQQPGVAGPGVDTGVDTGKGLSALGGGVGVDLSELLKNRLGQSLGGGEPR